MGTNNHLNSATYADLKDLISLQSAARKIDLNRKLAATARLTGNHYSAFRGRGMDYKESRIYQPGDDIRNMDWRVTARSGKPHTKLYDDERERPVFLLLDLSPRMFFASQGALKSVIVAKTAAMLAWAAAARGDRIGGLLLNQDYHEIRPKTGHHGVLQLIHQLVKLGNPVAALSDDHAESTSDLSGALKRLLRLARPGSQIFLISDFMTLAQDDSEKLMQLHQHNDLVAIQVRDPLEQQPPPPGQYAISNGSEEMLIDTRSRKQRNTYQQFFTAQQGILESIFTRNRIPLLHMSTTDHVSRVIGASYAKRRKGKAA